MKRKNKGFFLIESIVAIIIFSIGIVGIFNYQNNLLQSTSNAYNRIIASYLAESIIGQITIDQSNLSKYVNADESYTPYKNWIDSLSEGLPKTNINKPIITSKVVDTGVEITITIFWEDNFNNMSSTYTTSELIF